MAYMSAISPCLFCRKIFSYNPDLVPSMTVTWVNGKLTKVPPGTPGATKEPFCQNCLNAANASPKRKALGLPPLVALPGAYEPQPFGNVEEDEDFARHA